MKAEGKYGVLAVCILGAGSAWLWVWMAGSWAVHVDMKLFFPVLYKLTGINGPWMVPVGDTLFALFSAIAFSSVMTFVFRTMWWRLSLAYLAFFILGHIVVAIVSDTPLSFLATHAPLWLFVAFFALYSSIVGRRLAQPVVQVDAQTSCAPLD